MKPSSISRSTFSLFVVSALLMTPLIAAKPVSADPLGQITRYSTSPNYTSPQSTIIGPDGNIWFASNGATKKIGVMSTSGILLNGYTVPAGYEKIANLIVGPEGSIWFSAESSVNPHSYAVGKLTSTGNFNFYNLPAATDWPSSADPNVAGMAFMDGHLWVAQIQTRYLRKLLADGSFQKIEVSTPDAVTLAQKQTYQTIGITYDANNNCIATTATGLKTMVEKICSNSNREVTIVPPNPSGSAQGYTYTGRNLTYDSSGNLWFSGYVTNKLAYLDTSGVYRYVNASISSTNVLLTKGVLASDGNIWFAVKHLSLSKRSNIIAKLDTGAKTVTQYNLNLPSGYSTNTDGITMASDGNVWFSEGSLAKISKVGIGSVTDPDSDNDGLTRIQELQQGTSDFRKDTDNDGLSDYTESQWNTTRDDVFCHPTTDHCEYPDPLQQDIYIETDWMQRPNDGPLVGYSTQPSEYTTDMFKEAFSNKGIKLHIDRGQLGGGDEVPYEEAVQFRSHETGVIDFWDYRDGGDGIVQNFASNRKDIYRYMLMGNHLADAGLETTTGVSLAGADDIFISFGLIKENPVGYSLFDVAIAGTMHHELGHSLCLSNTSDYSGQSPSCVFAGIDQLGTTDYPSAMNYLYQMVLVDYSDGTNSSNDHDDWGAISPRDFTFNESLASPAPGITIEQMKTAAKVRKEKGIKVERKNGKFEVTQTQNGRAKKLN